MCCLHPIRSGPCQYRILYRKGKRKQKRKKEETSRKGLRGGGGCWWTTIRKEQEGEATEINRIRLEYFSNLKRIRLFSVYSMPLSGPKILLKISLFDIPSVTSSCSGTPLRYPSSISAALIQRRTWRLLCLINPPGQFAQACDAFFFMAFIDRISEGFRKSNVEHFCFQKFYTYSRPDAAVCCVVCMYYLHDVPSLCSDAG